MASTTLSPAPKSTQAGVADLPTELLFAIFRLLPLKSLIAAKGVCRHWSSAVRQSRLDPARRRLLDAFEDIIASAPPGAGRPRVATSYCAQDREQYLEFLTKGATAPDEFVLWVREWPAWGVFGWLWPDLDERKKVLVPRAPLLDLTLGGLGGWSAGAYGWSEPASITKPHVKCVTFTGGRTPFAPGAILRVVKVVPIEFAGIGIQSTGFMTDGGAIDPDEGIDLVILCFGGGNRAVVLDGKNGGEELKGMVYKVVEGYALTERTVCAKTWVDYLRENLLTPHPMNPPVKFHSQQPTAELLTIIEPF
ncbi:F-box protein [Phanerochaete sordida]|uniref:F-box protein n=1 Tax=Phanerochaete sordida TaxID=48140 RepID=A0A9P3G8K8_9APHY|nr:F-box protein [Phanerochaete sordida]